VEPTNKHFETYRSITDLIKGGFPDDKGDEKVSNYKDARHITLNVTKIP